MQAIDSLGEVGDGHPPDPCGLAGQRFLGSFNRRLRRLAEELNLKRASANLVGGRWILDDSLCHRLDAFGENVAATVTRASNRWESGPVVLTRSVAARMTGLASRSIPTARNRPSRTESAPN